MNWDLIWDTITSVCIDVAFKLLWSIVIFAVGSIVIKLVVRYCPKGRKDKPMDTTLRNFLITATKVLLYIIVIVSVVTVLGIEIASVIAVLASAGAAIALALQGALSNLASGIILIIVKPMKIGDFIEGDGQSGTVEDIGLFYTTLITGDKKRVQIPNSKLTTSAIVNYSTEPVRRVDMVFNVSYDTDVEKAKALITETVYAHELVLKDPEILVRMTELADSSLNITVRAYCENANYWTVKFDLTEQIKAMFDANGINVPYNQLDVHVKQ